MSFLVATVTMLSTAFNGIQTRISGPWLHVSHAASASNTTNALYKPILSFTAG